MVVIDEAFRNAGQKEGLEIWRIKKFQVERLRKEEYGTFYEGDSYIVLNVLNILASLFKTKRNLEWDVHFWLGKKTTLDEAGTAAMKTVELDNLLGGGPVEFREVQEHESALFLSYFKHGGIKYLQGGHDTGFRQTQGLLDKMPSRLFQVKGKRNVRVRQVELSCTSLNLGDVFILDCGKSIFIWMPSEAGKVEKIKAVEAANAIRDLERGGKANIIKLEQDWNNPENGFFAKLGGKGVIKSAHEGGHDEEQDVVQEKRPMALWRISDQTGQIKVDKVGEGSSIGWEKLLCQDAFILDPGQGGIFVWVGKGCTMNERDKAMVFATTYLKEMKKPPWTPVVRVLQGAEPQIFTQWFKKPPAGGSFSPRLFRVSDESGKMIWDEYCNYKQKDLDDDDVMILDAAETIFVWIGKGANKDEIQHAKEIAKQYCKHESLPRPSAGARVVVLKQGEETPEFKKWFPKWD